MVGVGARQLQAAGKAGNFGDVQGHAGDVAHLVEHRSGRPKVAGSSPVVSTVHVEVDLSESRWDHDQCIRVDPPGSHGSKAGMDAY